MVEPVETTRPAPGRRPGGRACRDRRRAREATGWSSLSRPLDRRAGEADPGGRAVETTAHPEATGWSSLSRPLDRRAGGDRVVEPVETTARTREATGWSSLSRPLSWRAGTDRESPCGQRDSRRSPSGNCRWSGLGFLHDRHPDRHRGRTRRARPGRVGGAGRGRRPRAAPRTRPRRICWRWRCTGWTCTRSPPSTRPRPSPPNGPAAWRRRWVRRSSTRHRWPGRHTGGRGVRGGGARRRPWACRTWRVWRWSPRRSSSATGCRGCGRWSSTGDLQAWKARQVAKATTMLSREAVGFVDRHLAVTARSNRLPALNPVLHEARLRCDPDQAAAVEQNALDHRGVWLDHRESTATTPGHRPDGHPGRPRPRRIDHRPGRAAGPARRPPQTSTSAAPPRSGCSRTRNAPWTWPPAPSPGPPRLGAGSNGSRGTLYLHVTPGRPGHHSGGGRVERLGTASLALLRDWLQRLSGVSIRPVLDPARTDSVDAHDPPAWMRELVHPPGPALRVPRLHRRRPVLRPRPPRTLTSPSTRVVHPARPPAEPRVPVPPASPGQDLRRLALPPPPRRRVRRSDLRVDQPPPPHLPRHHPPR